METASAKALTPDWLDADRYRGPMEVRLLGGIEVVGGDGGTLSVQGAKLRALLALLALAPGRVVATDRLIDDLWGDDPPATVSNALQGLVSKLRKALGSADLVPMQIWLLLHHDTRSDFWRPAPPPVQ